MKRKSALEKTVLYVKKTIIKINFINSAQDNLLAVMPSSMSRKCVQLFSLMKMNTAPQRQKKTCDLISPFRGQ